VPGDVSPAAIHLPGGAKDDDVVPVAALVRLLQWTSDLGSES
jgi:hypothetical protein